MGEIKLGGCLCERCEHAWISRVDGKPVVCPKCKSPYWDVPRKNGLKKEGLENFGLFPNFKDNV